MNSQTNKESSGVVKAAIIAGVFAVVAACVGGVFLILNTLVDKDKIVVIPTSAPVSQVNPVTEVPAIVPSLFPSSTPTPNQCQWLQTNFPQSADDAKAKYNLPSDTTFQFIYELCPSIANAFAFKAKSTVEIQVPSGGCVDSWSGFTQYVGDVGTPVEDGHGGWRVYKGIVRAPEMTIRILGCK